MGEENVIGKGFRGTIIRDPLIEPYAIGHYETGGYVVVERKEVNGKLKLTLLGYPSTFYGCLDMIAKNKLNVPGKVYDCIRNYINEYRSIISTLKEVVEI